MNRGLQTYMAAVLALMLLYVPPVLAEERADSLSLKVYFRQDVSSLELDYRGNALMLGKFVTDVGKMMADPSFKIQDIEIRSSASPEGAFAHNKKLSRKRGLVLKEYLQNALVLPDDKFFVNAVGEDWLGLREKVERNSVPDREKILEILDRHSDFVNGSPESDIGSPKKELMDLNGGKTWFWLLENIYPDLRSAGNTVVCRYTYNEAPVAAVAPVYEHRVDTLYVVEKHYYPAETTVGLPDSTDLAASNQPKRLRHQVEDRKTVFAFRSNLLLPLLNVGAEVPIGNRWSVGLDFYYPWLTRDFDKTHKDCIQLMFITPELRYWFGQEHGKGSENWSRRLLGHSVGLFGMLGQYDLGRNWDGYQGEIYSVGLDYMYGLPLGKGGAHMEFEIGLGYLFTPTKKYHVYTSGGKLFEAEDFRRDFKYVGPLKAGVSIVIPIFKKTRATVDDGEVMSDER